MKPLAIELFAGTGSGTAGWVESGGLAACFDLEYLSHHGDAPAGSMRVIQDVTTLHGSQFKDALFLWASPPCQKYSYLAMPWSRSIDPENSKAAKALRKKWETEGPDNRLFDACFRIQREAIEETCTCGVSAAGNAIFHLPGCQQRYIPLIVENVRGAVPWVGKQQAQFGSFYLWGDVAQIGNRVVAGRDLADIRAGRGRFGMGVAPERGELKGHGSTWFGIQNNGDRYDQREVNPVSGNKGIGTDRTTLPDGTGGTSWFGAGKRADPRDVRKDETGEYVNLDGTKIGGDWFSDPNSTCRKHGSRSNARKAASALIAMVPYSLARYLADVHWPEGVPRNADAVRENRLHLPELRRSSHSQTEVQDSEILLS